MLDRQDLLKDLRLVLGALEGVEKPSLEEIEKALERAEIDAQAFADIRSRWAGNTGLVASRVRPVAALLGVPARDSRRRRPTWTVLRTGWPPTCPNGTRQR